MSEVETLEFHSDDEEQKNQNSNAAKGAGVKN